jgi:FAD/FMN-containing dehydrogenase/Fe-S oxidoreductase
MLDLAGARRDSLARYLARHTAAEVRFDDTSRDLYATDASHYTVRPLGVVIPRTEADLVAAVGIAAELGVPITPRGGGTSLSGQSIGPGVVIDCSKHLNRVLDVDPVGRTARVQPGLVLDHLNRAVAGRGLQFGPDVATANRATLGGMIGNNSAGARSVVYGQTAGHVRSLRAVLSDGTAVGFGPLTPPEHERKLEARTREGDAYRAADAAVRAASDEIPRRFPDIVRKVSGYNLPGLLGRASGGRQPPAPATVAGRETEQGADAPRSPYSLVPLLVGSEGTLAVVAEAELALVPRPAHRGLLVPQFDSLRAALDAVGVCLALGPSAVELLDQLYLDLARNQRSLRDAMAAIRGRPAAVLMVEFSGDDPGEIADKVERLARQLRGARGLTAAVTATDARLRDPLWNLRSAAVPLLYSLPGAGKPVTFCEDTAVAPEKLPEFADRFRAIFRRHGTDGTFYGHASVGCLHIRPVLDLHAAGDVAKMRAIMADVTDLVLEFGGSLSGEHGDGLVRSEWNRKMFGPAVYEAFRRIKRGFDPANLLNPGKVVDGPAMEENLRVPPGTVPAAVPTVFDYAKQGGFFASVEQCNGAGVCRKTHGGAMCPSYRVTRDERDTTRGRANALRIALTVSREAEPSEAPLAGRWLQPVMDLCLSCKACKTECPSNVDVAKLKAEWLHAHYARRPRPVGHRLLKHLHRLLPLGAHFAGSANWLARRPLVRRGLEAVAGLDRRRPLPELHRNHLRQWFARRPAKASGRRVMLLDDCFTTFHEPHVGRAAVELLERCGYTVELAGVCCGRAMISKGYLADARDLARRGIARLAAAAADGVPVLGLEPSCVLTLADEWPELVPGPAAARVAAAAHLADAWLADRAAAGECELSPPAAGPVLFHGHCHQKALVGVGGSAAALRRAAADVTVLDAGCCGMAGAFGYEREHYDVSVAVANLALLPALAAAPAATVAATGTSCRHQIRDLTGRRAYHPIELLAGGPG